MGTINNESRELNLYRIEKFGLRRSFACLSAPALSDCASRRADIYRLALETTQIAARTMLLHRRSRPEPGVCRAS